MAEVSLLSKKVVSLYTVELCLRVGTTFKRLRRFCSVGFTSTEKFCLAQLCFIDLLKEACINYRSCDLYGNIDCDTCNKQAVL